MELEPHIGESAELYATGALDPAEQAEVDEHVARCDECLRRLGEAEETVLALERVRVPSPNQPAADVVPLRRRSVPTLWIAAAVAAAFVLGFVFPRPARQTDTATLAMVHSHFSHAQFEGPGPAAKVIYARDRSWYYVIVAGNGRYDVYGTRDEIDTKLGTTAPKGQSSELFVRGSARFDRLELRGDGILERATTR